VKAYIFNCQAEDSKRDRRWALVNAVMNVRFPQNAGNFFTSWGPDSFSRRPLFHGVKILSVPVQAIEIYGVVKVYLHAFTTSVLTGGKWLTLGPGRFTPWGNGPDTQPIRARLGEERIWTLWRKCKSFSCN
jgi:hypothetical protein